MLPALLAAAFLAAGIGPRLALCVGPSGHRAIEPVGAACCERTPAAAPSDLCARGCTDVPLASVVATRPSDGRALVAGAGAIPGASAAAPFPAAGAGVILRARALPGRPAPPLGPIVLRC
jgi:hypothetical protein